MDFASITCITHTERLGVIVLEQDSHQIVCDEHNGVIITHPWQSNPHLVNQAWKFQVHNPWNPECISNTPAIRVLEVGGVLWDLEWWMILPASPWWCRRFPPQLLLLLLISLISPAIQSPSSLVSTPASHTLFALHVPMSLMLQSQT